MESEFSNMKPNMKEFMETLAASYRVEGEVLDIETGKKVYNYLKHCNNNAAL